MSILKQLLILAVFSPAHAATAATPTDLVVAGYRWGQIVGKTFVTDRGTFAVDPDARLPRQRPGMPPPTVLLQRETYVLVKNTGSRTVKAVQWAYVFYADAKHEREVARVTFRSKQTVKPGEMKFLSESVKEAAPTAFDAVMLEDVEFEDAKR